MTASVFTVSHSLVGWLVSEGDRIAEVFSSRFWAQKGAEALAVRKTRGYGPTHHGGADVPQRRVLCGAPLRHVGRQAVARWETVGHMLCGMDRADTDVLLQALEAAIKRRTRHRGRPVFYQLLEYDLAPILAVTDDPGYVQARVREMLARYGHAPEPPARGHACAVGDFAHLCQPAPPRERPSPPAPP